MLFWDWSVALFSVGVLWSLLLIGMCGMCFESYLFGSVPFLDCERSDVLSALLMLAKCSCIGSFFAKH